MYVVGRCKVCGGMPIFNIGEMTEAETMEKLDEVEFGHCAVGYHVELGKMSSYYKIDWSQMFGTETAAREYRTKIGGDLGFVV